MSNITVIGDGAWGRALAIVAQGAGNRVNMWSRKNPDTASIATAHALIIAIPAQAVRGVMQQVRPAPSQAIIITAKGIDRSTHQFMHDVVASRHPQNPILILSGPSFAEDVSQRLPTAVTLAASRIETAQHWAEQLSQPHFRIYASDDLTGVAIGGSLKNVLAIACGISDGKQLGASARAALISRGFSELQKLGRALCAKPETLMGLSGLGDLLLTCSTAQSRNYAFGKRIGEGATIAQAIAASNGVVEGVHSAQAAFALAKHHALSMPITEAVSAIIEHGANPDDMIKALLARPITAEFT
jgi:glycerol-3-phosphate dehydrogenase (NAD(P)+)